MQDSTGMKKQAEEIEGSIDRLSQLPEPILHHILCFLSQKEAFQTCVLSKTWRYIGSTRPKFEFRESSNPRVRETVPECLFLDNTLQRYHDRKLSIKEFCLRMSEIDCDALMFLEKWIPVVMLNMGVKEFEFAFLSANVESLVYIEMPLAFFESESLQKLCLGGCKLKQYPTDSVGLFKHLKRLSLNRVYIEDKTLDKILLSCHLIEKLVLHNCKGLRTINVNKAHNKLKLFNFSAHDDDCRKIEIDAPTIETIIIDACPNWLNLHNNLLAHLSSLYLGAVQLSEKSFDNFSSNFPCLEDLILINCYGFKEFHLSSRSIEHLVIDCTDKLVEAVIDAPSLVDFEYEGETPQSIYFKSTASEWESNIVVSCDVNFHDFGAAWWCIEMHDMLKALNGSEISLDIFQELMDNQQHMEVGPPLVEVNSFGGLGEPVVVEHLCLKLSGHSLSTISVLISNLFYISRPINMSQFWYLNPDEEDETEENQLVEFLTKVLISERQMRHYSWQQDLEDVSMERVFDDGEGKEEVRFRLAWRDCLS